MLEITVIGAILAGMVCGVVFHLVFKVGELGREIDALNAQLQRPTKVTVQPITVTVEQPLRTDEPIRWR